MQNPVTFMPTGPTGNAIKQFKSSTNSAETSPNSFKQALSKEISVKQNAAQEKPPNTEESKAIGQDNKTNISKDQTTIELKDDDEQRKDVASSEEVQTNGVQIIALVENLAQFSPKVADKTGGKTNTEGLSIDTNVNNLTTTKFNPITIPSNAVKEKNETNLTPLKGVTLGVTGDTTLDSLTSAGKIIVPVLKSDESKSKELHQITNKAGIELTVDLKMPMKDPVKTDLRTDLKVNFTVDMKPDLQQNLKQNLQPDLQIKLKPDLTVNIKTDIETNMKQDLKFDITSDLKTGIKPDLNVDVTPDLKSGIRPDLKIDLTSDLKSGITPGLKTDLTPDLKSGIGPDLKVEATPEIKSGITTDLKAGMIPNLKIEQKTDVKIQETINIKEQNIKITETTPTAQNFAQQVAINTVQINTATEILHIPSRVGSPAWNQSVGQKIVWMVAGGQQTAELTLNPPDLGPMQVVLSVNNDQANATFISAHPDVREALESAMPKLRQMMSDAGVQLSGFSVKSESSNTGAQFAGDRSSSRSKNNTSGTLSGTSAIAATTNTVKQSSGRGIVDTFA